MRFYENDNGFVLLKDDQPKGKIAFYLFPNTDEMYTKPILTIYAEDFEIIKSSFLNAEKEVDWLHFNDFNYAESLQVMDNLRQIANHTPFQSFVLYVTQFLDQIISDFGGFTIDCNQ